MLKFNRAKFNFIYIISYTSTIEARQKNVHLKKLKLAVSIISGTNVAKKTDFPYLSCTSL
jgi:hypothetical protein